jgi:predicted aldo/keto reductase-like oxidoreductase
LQSLYGDSEKLLAKWFKRTGKRDQIFLASKFGFVKGSPTYAVDTSAEYCKKACNESLKALEVDYIDLCKLFLLALNAGLTSTRLCPQCQSGDPNRTNHASPGRVEGVGIVV